MGAGDFSPTTVRRACTVSGCERSAVGRGLCDMHYRRARRGGDTGSPSPRSFPRTCTLDGCDGKHYALGLCKKHHQRRWRHGTVEIIGRRYEKRPLADRVRELTPTEATDRGCLEWLGHRDRDGYGRLWFDDSSKPATRAVWIAHHGPIPDGLIVRHICDNPPCVNIAHLLLGAHADNARDKVERGRSTAGSRNPAAVLTESDIAGIHRMRERGESYAQIAAVVGVSKSQVWRICHGLSWPSA